MDVFPLWVLSGRGICDGLITRPEESYGLWCVVACDLGTSRMRRLKLARVVNARQKKKILDARVISPGLLTVSRNRLLNFATKRCGRRIWHLFWGKWNAIRKVLYRSVPSSGLLRNVRWSDCTARTFVTTPDIIFVLTMNVIFYGLQGATISYLQNFSCTDAKIILKIKPGIRKIN
jgi:hypothetical protein